MRELYNIMDLLTIQKAKREAKMIYDNNEIEYLCDDDNWWSQQDDEEKQQREEEDLEKYFDDRDRAHDMQQTNEGRS
jgi:hypothetical protein